MLPYIAGGGVWVCGQKGKRERKIFGKMSFGDELTMPPISP